MRYVYDPYIMRRLADGRIFFVNAGMPFEFFISCFEEERPFFLISQLTDGRIAIVPNVKYVPWSYRLAEGPLEVLPTEFEYVTMQGTYPVLLTAHPVNNFEDWVRKFEQKLAPFAQQTLADFVTSFHDFRPLKEIAKAERELFRETVKT